MTDPSGRLRKFAALAAAAGIAWASGGGAADAAEGLRITQVRPPIGEPSGGQQITLEGTGFRAGARVTVGGLACTDVAVIDDRRLTCWTPAHAPGWVAATIAMPGARGGAEFTQLPAAFRYSRALAVGTHGASIVGKTLAVRNRFRFAPLGGSPPYRQRVIGSGKLDAVTGEYVAPERPGVDTLVVTDLAGAVTTVQITINPELKVLAFEPGSGGTFTVSGGVPPYSYAAPGDIDAKRLRVTDSVGNAAELPIAIRPPAVALGPLWVDLLEGESFRFQAAAGKGPYRFEVARGSGWIDPKSGLFVAPLEAPKDDVAAESVVRVTDGYGAKAESLVRHLRAWDPRTELAAGAAHTCLVRPNDSTVWCWGDNRRGQLGHGDVDARDSSVALKKGAVVPAERSLVPVQVQGLQGAARSVVAGFYHTCALVDQGVSCWGDNERGQLGTRMPRRSSRPRPVPGLENGVTALAGGQFHTCALRNGQVYCWGFNGTSQLGIAATSRGSPGPVPVGGILEGATAITAGHFHSCAIVRGRARCWGSNTSGQLGSFLTGASAVARDVLGLGPADLPPGSVIRSLVAGANHTCAAITTGMLAERGASARGPTDEVWCWGYNGVGALGDADYDQNFSRPRKVAGVGGKPGELIALAAGVDHTCASTRAGDLLCWGMNLDRQLGSVEASQRGVPGRTARVSVLGPGGARAVTAGLKHTCARGADGVVRCWGDNSQGQLGTATRLRLDGPGAPVKF